MFLSGRKEEREEEDWKEYLLRRTNLLGNNDRHTHPMHVAPRPVNGERPPRDAVGRKRRRRSCKPARSIGSRRAAHVSTQKFTKIDLATLVEGGKLTW